MGAGQAQRQLLTTETQEHCVPRTAGALPATHGEDTEALHPSASPAETGAPRAGQGLCLLCRDAGLPPTQHCRDTGHCQDTELPPIHHRRDSGHCRNTTHPSLQGHGAVPRRGQSSTALPVLPTQQHCQPRTVRCEGTTHPALQGCRSPCIIHPALHALPSFHQHPSQKEGHCPPLYQRDTGALPTLRGSADIPHGADAVSPHGAAALHSPSTLQW